MAQASVHARRPEGPTGRASGEVRRRTGAREFQPGTLTRPAGAGRRGASGRHPSSRLRNHGRDRRASACRGRLQRGGEQAEPPPGGDGGGHASACARAGGHLEERAATDAQQLQEQLKTLGEELAEDRRRFDQTPASIARCARDGKIERANQALASLLGYDTPEALQKVDFAAKVFESGDELQWLIRHGASRRASRVDRDHVEERDGSRIIVRVLASRRHSGLNRLWRPTTSRLCGMARGKAAPLAAHGSRRALRLRGGGHVRHRARATSKRRRSSGWPARRRRRPGIRPN